MALRVKRPKQFDDLIDLLRDKDLGVFPYLKSVITFAAAIGFKHGVKEPVGETSEPINWTLFTEHEEQALAYAIALADTGDTAVFREDHLPQTISIFEEYACGGLAILQDKIDQANVMASIESILSEHENLEDSNEVGTLLDDFN